MSLSKNAEHIVKTLYCHKQETPKEVFKRVSNTLSLGDNKFEKQLYEAMVNGIFLPNSPCLKNAGISNFLSACFVLSIEDNIESIFETVKNCGMIFKFGGGVGINYSQLRPSNSELSSGGTSSGILSFMGIFDAIINAVKQGGMRRGAMMGVLNYDQPEIIDFIRCKLHPDRFTNFNFSVLVDNNFMSKIEKNETIPLTFKKEVWNSVGAKDLFDLIAFCAWNGGDPGLLFKDALNRDNITGEEIICTNPCGEIGLTSNEACTLGSINLSKFVYKNKLNIKLLEKYIALGTRTLLNINAIANYPTKDIYKKMKKYNRIGLGFMGFAEMLIKLGIIYDSEDTLKLIDEISEPYIKITDKIASKSVAKRTIAPTGTISRVANCSSGIEPLFGKEYISQLTIGNLKEGKKIYESKYCREADEISPEWHLKVQARWQRYCVAGDTIINTCNGDIPIKELVGQKNIFVYSYNNTELDIKKAMDIRMTREKAPIYEIELDNGNKMKATKEHKFLLRDGNYKNLEELNIGDSLMPFNCFTSSQGYKFIFKNINKGRIAAFRFVDEKINGILPKGVCIHHKDWIKSHDSPDNLERMNMSQHSIIHRDLAIKTGKANKGKKRTVEQRQNISLAHIKPDLREIRECLWCGKKFEIRKKLSKRCCSYNCAAFVREIEYNINKGRFKKGHKVPKEWREKIIIANKGRVVWNKNLTKETHPSLMIISQKMIGNINGLRNIATYNHKIIKIQFAGFEPVYNMEVEDTHNFAANGIFVHNCDNAVSKTINLPNSATVEDIKNIYLQAFNLGVKGITIFRDGSREGVLKKEKKTKPKCSDESCHL